MSDFITPAKDFPFRPGEAIYWLPATHRMTQPPPRIRGVVLTAGGYSTTIQREDGSRAAVNTSYLAYRAYCEHCDAPAITTTRGRLICPGCGGPVIDAPPPDEMVVLRFPIDFGWNTPMAMHRAIVNDWTYRQAIVDRAATIDRAYQRMLRQLGLAKPVWRIDAEYRIAKQLEYYAMLEHEAGFLASYCQLLGQPIALVPLAA